MSKSQNPPTVSQPSIPANNQVLRTNRDYLFSLTGILRFAIILFSFAAFVSAAAIPKIVQGQYIMPQTFHDTRTAYLFFTISSFILALLVHLLFTFNLVYARYLDRIPWSLVLLVTDGIWMISLLILGIICAVRESELKTTFAAYQSSTNQGSFASAAFFALLLSVIFGVDAAYYLIRVIRGGAYTPATREV